MKTFRTTRRMMITSTALATLALSTVAVTTANADPSEKKPWKGITTTVVDFGAYTSDVVENPEDSEDRDPTVNATNNTLAVSPDEKFAVATNSYSDRLVVIHLESGVKIWEIKGYVSPRNIVFAPDSKSFTVSDSARGVVDRISTTSFQVTKRLPLGAGVFGTSQSPDGKTLYANNAAADTVTVVDQANNRPVDVITGFHEPRQGTKVSHDGKTLYVTNYNKGDSKLSIVDLTNPAHPKTELDGFHGLRAISVDSAGDRLYAANSANDTISVVDLHDTTDRESIQVGDMPYGAALSPDGTVLLTGNKADNTLTAVKITHENGKITHTVLGTIAGSGKNYLKAPRQAISFSNDSKTAYVLNEDLTIAQVDIATRTVTKVLGR
ncbi:YncE family protein [Streptomyces coelicoflavus]|uniref:YncE family protein n=2 Tax=Streptomyces coelicoflavus TaxID=285562 RepID=UPI003661CA3D